MSKPIRPCPFCQIMPAYLSDGRYKYHYHNCTHAKLDTAYDALAISRWNTRPSEDQLRSELAAAQEKLARAEKVADQIEWVLEHNNGHDKLRRFIKEFRGET